MEDATDGAVRPVWVVRIGPYRVLVMFLCLLCLGTWALCVFNWELRLSASFYDSVDRRWPYSLQPPWSWIDNFGRWPAILLVTLGVIGTLLGLVDRRRRELGAYALCLLCVFALGPGLVINGLLKTCWGRPRPTQLREFDGEYQYHSVWSFGDDRKMCRSFCSGHASMGFYLFTPAFFLWRRWPRSATVVFWAGLAFGWVMGFSRMIQGQHFLSDILWSAVICYVVGLLVAESIYSLFLHESQNPQSTSVPNVDQQRRAA